ncbi:peptidylprolyl isomerase [Rariglobus hedericola]|uniref:Peptidylprolyl isomerase n=1 Tax=Rariglobus hedericola TaxID=2597822 RepID=A0A556QQX7_9BACT|nr:peptidyl-prolyl cis-trans isomerase [Rariglobus hedericola]TSJ79032.1 peptidylprolyl isomerase [Rariglobus hedericola]
MTFRRLRFLGSLAALAPLAALAQTPTPTPAATPNPVDSISLRFANGVVAVAEDKVITVDDLRREIAPRVPALQRSARNEKDFNERLETLQDEIIQQMIDRILIVKEFKKDEKRRVPESFINNAIAEEQIRRFDGDRAKFLAYLRNSGLTYRDYRKKVEDDMIYDYMRGQQRKNQNIVSPARVEAFYNENKDRFMQDDQVHMRLLSLTRQPGDTDEQLLARAAVVTDRFKAGTKFEDLARELSQDSKRTKGGDWGWQPRADLKPEFSEPLFKLEKGQITAPIVAPEAVYVLYVEDRKFAGTQSLADVREQIERTLINQMARESEERWIERLRRNAYVKIY